MPTVIDDATLLAVLTRRAGPHLLSDAAAGSVLTTGTWYYRLHRALHDPASTGSLSTMVAALSSSAQNQLLTALDDLPPEIVVPGPRVLVPVMGALRLRRRVNHLSAEALATALISAATIRVAVETALLRDACADLGIQLQVRSPFT
ncbi:MAG: hypothetical protein ACRDZ8_08530 [Acidimicrobiales bacterium]